MPGAAFAGRSLILARETFLGVPPLSSAGALTGQIPTFSRTEALPLGDEMARSHVPCATSIKRWSASFKLAGAWAGFYVLRLWEHILPTSVLSFLLRFPLAAWGLMQLRHRKLLNAWHGFPQSWRPKPGRFFLWQSLGLYHAQPLYIWPDRAAAQAAESH